MAEFKKAPAAPAAPEAAESQGGEGGGLVQAPDWMPPTEDLIVYGVPLLVVLLILRQVSVIRRMLRARREKALLAEELDAALGARKGGAGGRG
ncbi:MAG: hypothetical protein RQ752_02200 [Thermohalobaculum sp.]|nr:hypothetical protein [Thermohalobaculum sp.]